MRAIPASPFAALRAAPSTRRLSSKRPPLACAGKFCSSEQGVGGDNPEDPLDLSASQKRKTVSFFYEGKSEFLVRAAPHTQARATAARTHPRSH